MTENKRFKLGYVCGDYGLIDNEEWIDLNSMSENSEKNVQICINKMNELADGNEQLQSELSRYKEVNRLDIWKSSYSSEDALITELQMKCDKKQEHIVVLENKIRRMREAIHKLERLATHRNGELKRENEQLKLLIKKVLETTPIEHSLALDLKNSIRELYK